MTAHVLGNGPSISLFKRDEWPETDIFIGCNFSDEENLRPDYTVMVDIRPMRKFYEGYKVGVPMVISDRSEKFIIDKKGWDDMNTRGAIILKDIMPLTKFKDLHPKYALNSGQHAAVYALDNEDITDLHIWGSDTFWGNALKSNTDAIMRPSADDRVRIDIADPWRCFWERIFEEHPDHTFYIHAPEGVGLHKDYRLDNVKVVFHE